ncbi:MAG: hypothetical protein ACTHNW_01470 [Mucilaginibacter sp.]
MKNKFKLITCAALMLAGIVTGKANAQTAVPGQLQGSIGLEISDPTGTARIGSHFSLGGTARLQYGLSNNIAITATSGAYHFFTVIIPGTNKRYNSYGVIPIKAGIKAFFAPHVYLGAEAGVGIEATDSGFGPDRLLLSPAMGYATQNWDFALHYENFSSNGDHYGLVALRLAYAFKL